MHCEQCGAECRELAKFCANCGASLSTASQEATFKTNENKSAIDELVGELPERYSLEKVLLVAVDGLAALLYVALIWMFFFSEDVEFSGAGFTAMLIACAIIALIAKVLKSVVGSIGRTFDQTFNK